MSRWHSCNILQMASDASRLWQFDAKGGGFVLNREHRAAIDEPLPPRSVAKSWSSLWQPRLNVAWLPPENVFLRVVELPRSSFDETFAMVELQLEKLSPMPVAQIVWTIHILSRHGDSPRRSAAGTEAGAAGETKAEDLQTVVVVIAERSVVEEFLGKLEGRGYLADRLEVPMLDQLEATPATEDGAWIYPVALAGQSAALVAWWYGGALRNLSYVVLPPAGDRAKNLKAQLAQLAWAGELEGWRTTTAIQWHLVADPAVAVEWESTLRESLGEPVRVVPPMPPAELAAHTARRAAVAGSRATLLPAEFPARYHQQFVDRLWLRGLMPPECCTPSAWRFIFARWVCWAVQTRKTSNRSVADISGSYTNTLQLKARSDVLKERQALKYAALDCWKIVAEQLPPAFRCSDSVLRTARSFRSAAPPRRNRSTRFLISTPPCKRPRSTGGPMFDPHGGEPVNPRKSGNTGTWNFSLQLQHAEGAP